VFIITFIAFTCEDVNEDGIVCNETFEVNYFGQISPEDIKWLIRKGRSSYSGGQLIPFIVNGIMIGGCSYNLGGIDYIEFKEEFKKKGYLRVFLKWQLEDNQCKFVSCSETLHKRFLKYGKYEYNEDNDITTFINIHL
jgi:hypothetical protein